MYNETLSAILVFKTNICEESDLQKVAPFLTHEPGILKWNVDRADVDHVLRIETDKLSTLHVCQLVQRAGFWCEELLD